ncbi:Beta-barrel assembly machine subunit BamA [Cnuella takakiae]|uniref:Beta-barrel assembly machine subunit BamA n=1 Tax=Cnuella takakiae TaxID=1302690 RepID=A0A1M5D7Y6_9BACT|nr:POTRA domain-containing protein [Cnuella takakiae]OLY94993.1 outer membrane protein assembly factor [Cnuella takakiae]SHF63064.1 Beta-barrel assembly machine subunit BamA [Cnuella takakiae]
MLKKIPRIIAVAAFLSFAAASASAQVTDTTQPTSVDPELLALQNARVPKEFTINSITVTGANFLDTGIIVSISGIQRGDKLTIPGTDAFSKAITNLWKQRLFSNAQVNITSVRGDVIDVEIVVQERPKLGNFSFKGIKKSEIEELEKKAGLVKSTIITENTRRNAVEAIEKFYVEKGFSKVNVRIDEKPDPSLPNANDLTFFIDKGKKVKVNEVNFYGNEQVADLKLKKQMKGTKEMTKITLFPSQVPSPYGKNDPIPFKTWFNDLGFLSLSKTKAFLDPYFRFKLFSSAKFDPKKYAEDKEKVLEEYNALGYRDAQVAEDTMYYTPNGNLNIDLKVTEGRKYYFGNITWKGNTKYADSVLNTVLGIRKGDVYNLQTLNRRLGKQLTPEGGDISGLYMDDGYLFFRADPVETSVYSDTIDHEIRIVEGPQATIRNVNILGNEKTKDHVIRRELRTVPGEKFSRSDLIRSQRELAALNYFNQETINPGVVPNQEDGTVDINWKLEEKSSDQLELSAGWGGGIGLTGTLGVTFNNFSIKNIFNKKSWDPLPTGDGQKLSLRLQSNGRAFRSYNFSFTEPWLGGRKRNPLTVSLFSSKFSNAYDYFTGRFDKARSDTNYLRTLGATISLGKQLKWPDDYFNIVYSLNFTQYDLRNYPIFAGMSNGKSTNVSLKIALQRSSVFDPTYPRSGSNFIASVQATPPYSYLNPNLVTSANPYKTPEYHKWRFNAEWFVPIGKPLGADKNRQFVLKLAAKYGFMGRYNNKLDFSPFERFQVGGDGLTNQFGLLGYDVIALRGYPVFQTSDPTINPDLSQASQHFTIFNKYQMELRFPLVTQPSSTIYGLAFMDAANGWYNFKEYNPFRLRRSVGVGMRFFLPMFGLLGFDYGIGLDRLTPGQQGLKGAGRFTFMLGFEPE